MEDMKTIIERAEKNIRQAVEDYKAHTSQDEVLYDISDAFIERLAEDSSKAKQELRELFSKSPVYDKEIDALVINGTRTHNPNKALIRKLSRDILGDYLYSSETGDMQRQLVETALWLFDYPESEITDYAKKESINAINALAPDAYKPGKKLSRVFKSLCKALGVADETKGSVFQRLFAQLADELSAKKIDFKLYVSINPAHFLTMSNPKCDSRGDTLTSCHSLNSTEYQYNCGCTGYARDKVSFIVFTVENPNNPETLNNRKTTRQIFAYEPGNGLLLQSRMYNTSGGTRGAQEESKLYRDLIQREISALEEVPNLWKTYSYCDGDHEHCVEIDSGFGGYADWIYSEFDGKVSIRVDHKDDYEPLTIGEYGLCVMCGEETSDGMYCEDCNDGYKETCDQCGDRVREDDLTRVYGINGQEEWVCDDCLERYYRYCDECNEYHHRETVTWVDDICVCEDCLEEHYDECLECGEYCYRDNMTHVYDDYGCSNYVCDDCVFEYTTCPECDRIVKINDEGKCPCCGHVMEESEDEAV